MKRHRRRKRNRKVQILSWVLTVGAALALGLGLFNAHRQYIDNRNAEKKATQALQRHDAPSTKKPTPSEFDRYAVPPDNPRYLFIPKIAVKAMVKPLGVTRENAIMAPLNVNDVGWYNRSAKPGKLGATLLDGHISSWTAHGVFYDLKKLVPGDEVIVQKGDDTRAIYKVVKSEVYDADKVDMRAALSPVNPKKTGLNLISCDGQVIKDSNEFNKRLVVFAEAI